MSTATYTPGQSVEVRVADFKAPGMPYIWVPAEVVTVTEFDGKSLDVRVALLTGRLDRNGDRLGKSIITTYRSRINLRPAAVSA